MGGTTRCTKSMTANAPPSPDLTQIRKRTASAVLFCLAPIQDYPLCDRYGSNSTAVKVLYSALVQSLKAWFTDLDNLAASAVVTRCPALAEANTALAGTRAWLQAREKLDSGTVGPGIVLTGLVVVVAGMVVGVADEVVGGGVVVVVPPGSVVVEGVAPWCNTIARIPTTITSATIAVRTLVSML